jgi:hypothetical protein
MSDVTNILKSLNEARGISTKSTFDVMNEKKGKKKCKDKNMGEDMPTNESNEISVDEMLIQIGKEVLQDAPVYECECGYVSFLVDEDDLDCPECEDGVLECIGTLNLDEINEDEELEDDQEELDEAFKFAVRGGKKTKIRVRRKVHKFLSAARKMALKKARKFAHKGMANKNRLKSLKKRKTLGLNNSNDSRSDKDSDDNKMKSEIKAYLESIEAPNSIVEALKEGNYIRVNDYINAHTSK